MKILHTSDWHLGRQLFGRKRYQEFAAFLDWLAEVVEQQAVDVLLVAGDVFDTNTPSHRAQELYYQFLYRMAGSASCRHVVIIAGNHDSPSFLDAPKALLKALHVHVIGQASSSPADEVLVLHNAHQQAELIVCAVPYLRDRDLRTSQAGESLQDKERQLLEGIRSHYQATADYASQLRSTLHAPTHAAAPLPIIGMGHLFTAGGQTIDGDGVRELYVGSLAHVGASIFPTIFDYVALGHLHVPQVVGGQPCIRYSGSPIPMGFGEAAQRKVVCLIEWQPATTPVHEPQPAHIADTAEKPAQHRLPFAASTEPEHSAPTPIASSLVPPSSIQLLEVPNFQALVRIQGDWPHIERELRELAHTQPSAWLEVSYTGPEIVSDLRERIDQVVAGTALEVLRVRNQRIVQQLLGQSHAQESLESLSPDEVFLRCLQAHGIEEQQRPALIHSYQEIVRALEQHDPQAE